MKKRFLSFVLAVICMSSFCVGAAFATESRASTTLTNFPVSLVKGDKTGEIKIFYDVQAKQIADSVGVSSIEIYKSDGTYVTTITGSTSNGLVRNSVSRHRSTYTYTGTSGTSYYAEVTVFAKIGSDYDSRTVTTAAVKAP